MENLEQFLQSFEHPLDWAGHTVETHPPLKVGDVVRLFFQWEEEGWNKHYVRILEIEDGPVCFAVRPSRCTRSGRCAMAIEFR